MNRVDLKKILKLILTKPTAPYHEQLVIAEIEKFVEAEGLKVQTDTFGNRIVIYKPKGRAKKGRIGFVAHTDHPGFEITSVNGKKAEAVWRGGVWKEFFTKAKVEVQTSNGSVKGVVSKTVSVKGMPKRVETMSLKMDQPVEVGNFGQWDVTQYKHQGQLIVTRAADDLISVVSMLALIKELKKENIRHEVWFIFSRAEETGFVGSIAMMDKKTIPEDLPLISLETSKQLLPGGEQGKGPVIRLGDWMTAYSSDLLLYMDTTARKYQAENKKFGFQRRVMDGGTCEASLFVANGYTAAGIAFPLGNYHNMGDEPDEKGKPALRAETVHMRDLQDGVTLMLEICRNLSEYPKTLGNLQKRLRDHGRKEYRFLKENLI